MLLSKLAKANTAHNLSPSNSPGRQSNSGSKRATLEIFSQLRQAEDLHNQDRATEEEIESMLNQNLFRDNPETPDNAFVKQFQLASDVANDLLDDDACDDLIFGGKAGDVSWTSANQANSAEDATLVTLETRAGSEHLGSPEGPSSDDLLNFGGISAKAGRDGSGLRAEPSAFSPLATAQLGEEHTKEPNTTKDSSRITPRLNAQTLFAFGADAFSSAFSDAKQGNKTSDKVAVNPWMLAQSELSGSKVENHQSAFGTNSFSETAEKQMAADTLKPFTLAKCARKDLFSSLIDSSAEDILATGISLERSKHEKKLGNPGSPHATNSTTYTAGFGNTSSTQDENSFQSMATRSENTPPQFAEKINGQAKFFMPHRAVAATNVQHVQAPYPFMTDVNCAAPVFKPSAATFVFNPVQQQHVVQIQPAPCQGQCQMNNVPQQQLQQQQQQLKPAQNFNVSDHQYSSTYASSTRCRSDTSADFMAYGGATAMGQRQAKAPAARQIYEVPKILASDLSTEEIDICKQVETLAFDQAGCRMIQKKLEESQADKSCEGFFAASLIHVMLDILPDVMTNQFGNYLCQKLIEVAPTASIKKLVHACLPSLVEVAMDLHGTRAIQTLVEVLGSKPSSFHQEILAIGAEMSQYIFDLSTHPNGNHVIQAFLLTFKASDAPEETDRAGAQNYGAYTQFIFGACMAYCDQIGSDKHGCCVMQRCLEKGLVTQKLALADVIISRIHFLIEDPYGNYLVQNVLKLKNELRNDQILNFIAGDFVRLSQLKFSSNVIEKCLETGQAAGQIEQIFKGTHFWDDQVLVRELGFNSRCRQLRVNQIVHRLVTHQFGNYVLQKAIAILTDADLKREILESIQMLSGSLSQTKHGQKVLTKLQKAHPHIFTAVIPSMGVNNPMLTNTANGNCQVKQGASTGASHQQHSSGQQKKRAGNRKGQKGRTQGGRQQPPQAGAARQYAQQ